jgi:hypothetical protein
MCALKETVCMAGRGTTAVIGLFSTLTTYERGSRGIRGAELVTILSASSCSPGRNLNSGLPQYEHGPTHLTTAFVLVVTVVGTNIRLFCILLFPCWPLGY